MRSEERQKKIESLAKLFCNVRVLSHTTESWLKLSLTLTAIKRALNIVSRELNINSVCAVEPHTAVSANWVFSCVLIIEPRSTSEWRAYLEKSSLKTRVRQTEGDCHNNKINGAYQSRERNKNIVTISCQFEFLFVLLSSSCILTSAYVRTCVLVCMRVCRCVWVHVYVRQLRTT